MLVKQYWYILEKNGKARVRTRQHHRFKQNSSFLALKKYFGIVQLVRIIRLTLLKIKQYNRFILDFPNCYAAIVAYFDLTLYFLGHCLVILRCPLCVWGWGSVCGIYQIYTCRLISLASIYYFSFNENAFIVMWTRSCVTFQSFWTCRNQGYLPSTAWYTNLSILIYI